jgi:hypothetical protein
VEPAGQAGVPTHTNLLTTSGSGTVPLLDAGATQRNLRISLKMVQENELLNTSQVDSLVTLIEEATRATKDAPRRFIKPARGTLNRAKSRRHHIVFGRRGSGKTSLLRKAGADLTLLRIPIAFIDVEAFKGHAYPDVLLSILIETLNAFDNWLATAGLNSSAKLSFWRRLWGGVPEKPPLDKKTERSTPHSAIRD